MWVHVRMCCADINESIDIIEWLKAPIHEATLLLATVACNNVAACMMQCCVVACCWQLLLAFRLQFYFQATVAGNTQQRNIASYTRQHCCRQLLPATKLPRVWGPLCLPGEGPHLGGIHAAETDIMHFKCIYSLPI